MKNTPIIEDIETNSIAIKSNDLLDKSIINQESLKTQINTIWDFVLNKGVSFTSKLLYKINNEDFLFLLKITDEKVMNQINESMSSVRIKKIYEDLELMGPVKLTDIIKAHKILEEKLNDLEKEEEEKNEKNKIISEKNDIIKLIKTRTDILNIEQNGNFYDKLYGDSFQDSYIPEKYRNDEDFLLELIEINHNFLVILPIEMRNDKTFMLKVIEKNPDSFIHASIELKNDEDFVLRAVKKNGLLIQIASDDMRNDFKLGIASVKSNGKALAYLSIELKNNEDIVIEAIKNNVLAIRVAGDELRNNKEFILKADLESIKTNEGLLINNIPDKIRKDRTFLLKMIIQNPKSLSRSGNLKTDKKFVLEALEFNENVFEFISSKLKNDRIFLIEAINTNPKILKFIPVEIMEDKTFQRNLKLGFLGQIFEKLFPNNKIQD